MGRATVFAIVAFVLSGCTHALHVNHTSDYVMDKPIAQYRVVKSRASQESFLGMVGNTDYVDQAFEKLKKTCPDGSVTGIQTRYSTRLSFLSWTHEIQMTGHCSQASHPSTAAPR